LSPLGPRIAALLLGLAGAPDRLATADLPSGAGVIADVLDVFDAPDDAATVPGQLRRGDRVLVRDAERAGWLTIDPPTGSFCWVEQSAIGDADRQSRTRVVAAQALVRSGNPRARMPGTPRCVLPRGAVVRLLDRAPLTLGEGHERRTWYAIAPPPGDVRYIRAEGVRLDADVARDQTVSGPVAEIRVSYAPEADQAPLPPEVARAIAQAESVHRAILNQPIEQWRLEGVRQRYEALLRGVTDSASGNAIRARLDLIARHEAMAKEARLVETLLQRSRRRDAALALSQRRLADAQSPQARPYDLQGLIQPSSRQVDGRKVFALIGRDGQTQAYLDIPPGIDVKPLLTHRVGVRGTSNYNESLHTLLIRVRDVHPLDAER
jgi:hypothetical protein